MQENKTAGELLPTRTLGRTGLSVPALALGGFGLGMRDGVTDQEAIGAVHFSLEQGLRYFDTAPMYGESERRIGLALKGVDRSSYVLSTKTGSHPDRRGDYSWDATMWSIENSQKLLNTDYFDIVHIHDCDRLHPDGLDPSLEPRGALAALEELKRQGAVRNIGLGVRPIDMLLRAINTGRFDVILTFNEYNLIYLDAVDELFPRTSELNIGVVNGSPMAQGQLSGEDPRTSPPTMFVRPNEERQRRAIAVYDWCKEHGVPMRALVFQFCMRNERIHSTLTGARNRREFEENLRAATEPLPESTWDELADLHARICGKRVKDGRIVTSG